MAMLHFREKHEPPVKRGWIPSKKWKIMFLISLIINVILGLTTLYVANSTFNSFISNLFG